MKLYYNPYYQNKHFIIFKRSPSVSERFYISICHKPNLTIKPRPQTLPESQFEIVKDVKEEKEDLPFILLVLRFSICRTCVCYIYFNRGPLSGCYVSKRLKFLLCQKSQIFLYAFISVVRISFCSVFISSDMFATAFINSYLLMLILYSYCRDLFYLYCKIPNNFGQGRNMAGRIYFISNTTRYHRLKTNRCKNRTLHFYIEEEKMLISSRFSIISSQLFTIYISIFHKTEVLTVILRC